MLRHVGPMGGEQRVHETKEKKDIKQKSAVEIVWKFTSVNKHTKNYSKN